MEKTVEMLKWGKGYYVMTRIDGRPKAQAFANVLASEFIKTKTAATAMVKELKKQGYTVV